MARSSLAGAVVFLATRFLLLLALASAARIAFVLALRFYMRRRNVPLRRRILSDLGVLAAGTRQPRLVGLFHPYCNAGGGGERVLWAAVACLQREEPDVICLIYTGDTDATKAEMVEKAQARFGIALDRDRMHLVYLQSRHLVEDSTWTRFTLLGQSLGSIVLGHEALFQILPDIFIDTMGYAFTFPLVKLYADIPVGAYVHYPTISTDMLQRVKNRTSGHTNTSAVARSGLLSRAKLVYYVIFAWLYAWCLWRADYIMVNSSWTQAHVNHLLRDGQKGHATAQPGILALRRKRAHIVYPPCDTKSLAVLPLENREELILSVAQFRPEKEHATQLRAFKAYLDRPDASPRIKLVLAGSVRNAGDSARVDSLRSLATDTLGIPSSRIEFIINPPFRDLVALFSRASVGLSTMVDEHFGINVVEFMCAGLVPLVHASGGPLLDIVTEEDGQPTGYHAKAPEDYADKLATILALSRDELLKLRGRARRKAIAQFREANFDEGWMQAWSALKRLTIRK